MPGSSPQGKEWFRERLKQFKHEGLWVKKVLDIGIGQGTYSDLYRREIGGHWTGVEAYMPYVRQYGLVSKYDNLVLSDVRELDLKPLGYFEVAFLGDVLEHMTKDQAIELYTKLLVQSRYVFVSLPIVYYEQGAWGGNEYERHIKPDWTHQEVLASLPFIIHSHMDSIVGCYVGEMPRLPT